MLQNGAGRESLHWQRRLRYLIAGVFILCSIITARMFQKGVLEHGKYLALARKQYLTQQEVPARRGQVFIHDTANSDQYYPLATSVEKYNLNIVPKNLINPGETARLLAPIIGVKEEEIFNKINNKKLYIPPLKKRLDKETADKIRSLNIDGILLLPENVRFYPENELASHLLGFVNSEGVGKYGLEGYYNSELKGAGGKILAEKDTFGRIISSYKDEGAIDGSDLYLTIDHNLQYFVQTKLAAAVEKYQADSGSIIIVNSRTGAIVTMSSYPSFDPNKYNEVPADQQNIFLSPVTSLVWEPGSVFKTISMAAALEEKKIEPDTEGDFSNYTVVDGYEIHTAQDKAFGRETMTQCLENSDNVCLVWVADKLGNDLFYRYLESFGFGEKTNIDLDGETSGYLLPLKDWRNISRATMAFGQGISATPLQMVMAIAAIANGGKLMQPSVVEKIIKPSGEQVIKQQKEVRQVITRETAEKLTNMMISVVERGHGKKASVNGYKIAGKTGTAQVPNPAGGYFEDRHIGSFGGFFPADNPQFAMLVKLDNPKNVEWAESSAAPTFGEIASWLLSYYKIPPSY